MTRALQTSAGHPPHEWDQAFRFAALNALSFQIVLGAPMLLYAKDLGASATTLGLITGLLPLLVILQIPAARHVHRFGYKRFVLAGWSVRTGFIAAIATVPLLEGWATEGQRLALILVLLFLFNAARGISSCAWLPWISSIIPSAMRGRFLLREAAMINLASIACVVLSALVLGHGPRPGRYALLFAISAVAAFLSLLALKRIPEEKDPDSLLDGVTPVRFTHMLRLLPFRRLLAFNLAWGFAGGGVLAFAVAYLKTRGGLADSTILLLNSAVFLGGLSNLWLLQPFVDALGSRHLLLAASSLWLVVMTLWTLLAGSILPMSALLIFPLMLLSGLGISMVNLANVRLAMTVIPERGRSHYFVVFSVIGNVALGLAPIGWGILIDRFASLDAAWYQLSLNRYTIAFAGMTTAFLVLLLAAWRIEEPDRIELEGRLKEILTKSRIRHWLRLWPRG